ncbi:MAG: flagellin [Bacillota bacterium]|uniref:flagellin N-terminal helical domain-containing protein n=1 Tax=Cytobacillus firmus TaxID=1399 RepID=UPI0015800147|nr:flagellin [Cytobacillus firmus]NUH85588.1 flagellin [Cytobacillus firmus]
MRINHNIAALNTYRQLNTASTAQGKSMEKLSSGLRINKAGDDAAGLAISEKMRGQIRGLDMAAKNAQDGVSLLQTAEGALNETHDILQRMRELAVQSSNDTNTNTDREELQKEVDQLAKEITRIAENTEFNTKKLINGAADSDEGGQAFTFHIGANTGQSLSVSIKSMTAESLGVTGTAAAEGSSGSATITPGTLNAANGTVSTPNSIVEGEYTVEANDTEDGYELLDSEGTVVATSSDGITFEGNGVGDGSVSAETLEFDDAVTSGTVTVGNDGSVQATSVEEVGGETETPATVDATLNAANGTVSTPNSIVEGEYTIEANDAGDGYELLDSEGTAVATSSDGITFEGNGVGDGSVSAETLVLDEAVTSGTVTVANDGTVTVTLPQEESEETPATGSVGTSESVTGINISTQSAANDAIDVINTAIESVSAERSKLGAYQNRLEHSINNLNTSSENLTAAESRVRDVDMAKEMMAQTKNSILSQAAQAMLAQSNQMPQGVLQLLR